MANYREQHSQGDVPAETLPTEQARMLEAVLAPVDTRGTLRKISEKIVARAKSSSNAKAEVRRISTQIETQRENLSTFDEDLICGVVYLRAEEDVRASSLSVSDLTDEDIDEGLRQTAQIADGLAPNFASELARQTRQRIASDAIFLGNIQVAAQKFQTLSAEVSHLNADVKEVLGDVITDRERDMKERRALERSGFLAARREDENGGLSGGEVIVLMLLMLWVHHLLTSDKD